MRISLKLCLSFLFTSALIGLPAMAGPAAMVSTPLGVVLQADHATVGTDITSGGATIYEGDLLETNSDGTLRARLGGPQMYLHQNSAAEVRGLPNGFAANLKHGTILISSAKGQDFQLLANGATIRPVGGQDTLAQVTWVNPQQLLLTTTHGAVEVAFEGEVKTIEAGASYRVEVETADPEPQGPGPLHTGRRRRLLFYLIGGGVAAATAIGVWRVLVSPCAP